MSGTGTTVAVTLVLALLGCDTVRTRAEPAEGEETGEGEATAAAEVRPPAVVARAIAAGLFHSCAVTDGGAVLCWGQNVNGVVDGTGESRTAAPTRVEGVEDATGVAVARDASCARHAEGGVHCWGAGASTFRANAWERRTSVLSVASFPTADGLALGSTHACSVAEQQVHCLGNNDVGQRAHELARYTPGSRPNVVDGLEGVTQVAAGKLHTCALAAAGTVHCFGANGAGQLGDGRETYRVFSPRAVSGLDDAARVAACFDGYMTCAERRGGRVVCWGSRGTPQDDAGLVLVGREPVELPGQVDGVVQALEVGLWEVCVIDGEGAVQCWSESLASVRGEADAPPFGEPRRVEGLPPVVELSIGVAHSCARTEAGSVLCWGLNEHGQLGDGTTEARESPVVVDLAAGGEG